MILECLLPEVQIWRLPNRKPLHWRHSVGVSPVWLRTHWATKLVVGTLNFEKGRKLQYSVHFRSFTYFCVVAFTSPPYCFLSSSPIARYVAASGLAAVISISGFRRLSVNYPLMPLISMTSKICAKLLKSTFLVT